MASPTPSGHVPNLTPDQNQNQELKSYLDENEANGAPVHSFHPDATPQEKAAIAGKAQSQLQSVVQQQTIATSQYAP